MKTKTIIIPEFEDCAFGVECLPETMPIKGNASAIDDETDAIIEKHIKADLESGNQWAWCCVRVTCYRDAMLNGVSGVDYLGGCSYENEDDFIKHGGYWEDMKRAAYANFVANIEAL